MQTSSSNIQIRRAMPEDLKQVWEFGNLCDIAEYGEPDTDLDDLSDLWDASDLTRDAWIAVDGSGQIYGYALISGNWAFHLDFYAHRDQTPPEIPDQLLELCEKRAVEILSEQTRPSDPLSAPFPWINGFVTEANPVLQHAYERRGFSVLTYRYRMQIDFTGPLDLPEWPDGCQLSTFQPGDEQELFDLIDSTFDWPGRIPISIETWRELIFRNGRFDPQLYYILRREGRLVGGCLSLDERPRGWIKQLAVAKDLQGQGIGTLLLRHTLAVFSRMGMDYAALGVTSTNQQAVQFYQRCGMRQSRLFLEYSKQLSV